MNILFLKIIDVRGYENVMLGVSILVKCNNILNDVSYVLMMGVVFVDLV